MDAVVVFVLFREDLVPAAVVQVAVVTLMPKVTLPPLATACTSTMALETILLATRMTEKSLKE